MLNAAECAENVHAPVRLGLLSLPHDISSAIVAKSTTRRGFILCPAELLECGGTAILPHIPEWLSRIVLSLTIGFDERLLTLTQPGFTVLGLWLYECAHHNLKAVTQHLVGGSHVACFVVQVSCSTVPRPRLLSIICGPSAPSCCIETLEQTRVQLWYVIDHWHQLCRAFEVT